MTSVCYLNFNGRDSILPSLQLPAASRVSKFRIKLASKKASIAMILSPVRTTLTSCAPWKHQFENQVNQNTTQEFTLATVANINGHIEPRARLCGFRGFFPASNVRQSVRKSLQEQYHLLHGLGSPIFGMESDMLSFTTDVRMEKINEIQANKAVEAVFFLRDLSTQWRIKGTAHIIGASDSDPKEHDARREIACWFRKLEPPRAEPDPVERLRESNEEETLQDHQKKAEEPYIPWSWDEVVTIYYANHSPVLRGSSSPLQSVCSCWYIVVIPRLRKSVCDAAAVLLTTQ